MNESGGVCVGVGVESRAGGGMGMGMGMGIVGWRGCREGIRAMEGIVDGGEKERKGKEREGGEGGGGEGVGRVIRWVE